MVSYTTILLLNLEERRMTMEHMHLFIEDGYWMMRTDSPETKAHFGTDTLPMPFSSQVRASQVYATVRELNPDAIIVVKGIAISP